MLIHAFHDCFVGEYCLAVRSLRILLYRWRVLQHWQSFCLGILTIHALDHTEKYLSEVWVLIDGIFLVETKNQFLEEAVVGDYLAVIHLLKHRCVALEVFLVNFRSTQRYVLIILHP